MWLPNYENPTTPTIQSHFCQVNFCLPKSSRSKVSLRMYTYNYNSYDDQFFGKLWDHMYLANLLNPLCTLRIFLGVDLQVLNRLLSKSAEVLVPGDLGFAQWKVPGLFVLLEVWSILILSEIDPTPHGFQFLGMCVNETPFSTLFWKIFWSSSCEEFFKKILGKSTSLERFFQSLNSQLLPQCGWLNGKAPFFFPENTPSIRSVLYETVDGSSIFGKQVGREGRNKDGWLVVVGWVWSEKKPLRRLFFVYEEHESGEDVVFFWKLFWSPILCISYCQWYLVDFVSHCCFVLVNGGWTMSPLQSVCGNTSFRVININKVITHISRD